jgi:hypothetical protein
MNLCFVYQENLLKLNFFRNLKLWDENKWHYFEKWFLENVFKSLMIHLLFVMERRTLWKSSERKISPGLIKLRLNVCWTCDVWILRWHLSDLVKNSSDVFSRQDIERILRQGRMWVDQDVSHIQAASENIYHESNRTQSRRPCSLTPVETAQDVPDMGVDKQALVIRPVHRSQ